MNCKPTATGFYFEPLPGGNVRVVFQDENGEIINEQVISGDAFRRLPVVIQVTEIAVDQGADAAVEIVRGLRDGEGQ